MDDLDRRILAVERMQWGRHLGLKEDHIRRELGITATRYYQRLNALLDNPEAVADPDLRGCRDTPSSSGSCLDTLRSSS